ncbi:hypothetical protein FPOAC1_003876 [Fusarium poae]|uniref:hypothetical protein n=1 Tax=Fusarium poae TaxID=36050 RepID=UPI001CE77757|nr:hypothetical protein FPOAC1_003876 [Fusarium poae]KAG8677848.1 hypothetical protein FPOAC1_003876 [Fusarium poae]
MCGARNTRGIRIEGSASSIGELVNDDRVPTRPEWLSFDALSTTNDGKEADGNRNVVNWGVEKMHPRYVGTCSLSMNNSTENSNILLFLQNLKATYSIDKAARQKQGQSGYFEALKLPQQARTNWDY